MDQRKFEELLSEVCEWQHEPIVGPYARPSRRKKVTEQQLNDDALDISDDDVVEITGTDDLRTRFTCDVPHEELLKLRPIKVTALKPQPQHCGDCGKLCESAPRREHKQAGHKHNQWRTRCLECGHYQNPATGEFSLNIQQSYKIIGRYAVQKKHKELAKG